jgi:hypothetical protein
MQPAIGDISPLTLLSWTVACILAVATSIIYYEFIYKKTKRDLKRVQSAHFYPRQFINDMTLSTFEPYDKKWTRLIVFALSLVLISIIGPVALGIPAPLNGFICITGIVISLWLSDKWWSSMNTAEQARNLNTTYVSAHCLFSEEGEKGLLIKRTNIKNEARLSEAQCEVVVDNLIATVKTLPTYDPAKINETELRNRWLQRLKGVRAIRAIAGEYHLIFITNESFQSLKTPDTADMIDQTIHVKVPLAPMFAYYVGPATQIFRDFNEKGDTVFSDRRAGVFITLFDLAKRNELLATGNFQVPTYEDALLGLAVHHIEQNAETATSMTNTEMNVDKANKDLDEKKFTTGVEAIVAAAQELNKSFAKIEAARGRSWSMPSLGKIAKIVLIVLLIGIAAFVGYAIPHL